MKSALAQLVEPFAPTEGVPKRKKYLNSYIREAAILNGLLDDTGEIWMSSGNIYYNSPNNEKLIRFGHIQKNWIEGLEYAMECMNILEASPCRRVIIGVGGLKSMVWHYQAGQMPKLSRKPDRIIEETKRNWKTLDMENLAKKAWHQLEDAYGFPPMEEDQFNELLPKSWREAK